MLARIINGQTVPWDGRPFEHPLHPEWGSAWKPCSPELWSAHELADAGFVVLPDPVAVEVPACQLWQLQAVMTPAQWAAAQTAVAALNNPTVTAFLARGTSVIQANSATLTQLGQAIGLTPAQVAELVQQASIVHIP